jgi:hypothetical protein
VRIHRVACTVALATALATSRAGAQERIERCPISSVGDTTLAFKTGSAKWIKSGQTGSAVDPRRRDALVARFRIVSVSAGDVTAVITGQTTAVSTDHVALLAEPPRSWVRSKPFWLGLVLGAALGAVGASL